MFNMKKTKTKTKTETCPKEIVPCYTLVIVWGYSCPIVSQNLELSTFNFNQSSKYILIFHCVFNLHFSDDLRCGYFFNVLSSDFLVPSSVKSVQIYCPHLVLLIISFYCEIVGIFLNGVYWLTKVFNFDKI